MLTPMELETLKTLLGKKAYKLKNVINEKESFQANKRRVFAYLRGKRFIVNEAKAKREEGLLFTDEVGKVAERWAKRGIIATATSVPEGSPLPVVGSPTYNALMEKPSITIEGTLKDMREIYKIRAAGGWDKAILTLGKGKKKVKIKLEVTHINTKQGLR